MDFRTSEGPRRYDELLAVAADAVVGLDFDGTLSPIVEDPAAARIHSDAPDVLLALAAQVHTIAIVTGRPARQVVDLGDLDELAGPPRPGGWWGMGRTGKRGWDRTTRRSGN